ncbi:MAG: hypothetical protein FD163_336 [Hyphomonadaceae bacterium]|nr:MAG: hypothetical protein FD128_80 [Hyphomonadaceae bacterium]KAF0187061.1 MAG: hypothetical protein FD163_336 [Hyphomonadaceae bacterium]
MEIVTPDIIDALAAVIGSALGPLCVMFAPTIAIERTLRNALLQEQITTTAELSE